MMSKQKEERSRGRGRGGGGGGGEGNEQVIGCDYYYEIIGSLLVEMLIIAKFSVRENISTQGSV